MRGMSQRLGRQELQRLLHGTPAEQDLLGLLTAARGGLSGPDLEELTGAPLWEIEEILHTVAGRTFTRRASQLGTGTGPEVYLLGHEELQAAATRYLGQPPGRLPRPPARLGRWLPRPGLAARNSRVPAERLLPPPGHPR